MRNIQLVLAVHIVQSAAAPVSLSSMAKDVIMWTDTEAGASGRGMGLGSDVVDHCRREVGG